MGKIAKLDDLRKDLFILDAVDLSRVKGGRKKVFFWFGGCRGIVPQ